jgi:hypothetical protein
VSANGTMRPELRRLLQEIGSATTRRAGIALFREASKTVAFDPAEVDTIIDAIGELKGGCGG